MAEKMTKAMWFDVLETIVEASDSMEKEGALEFIAAEKALIASRAEKAKERAAKTKAEGDELREKVKAVLTDELQTGMGVFEKLDAAGEDVTKAKVTARLTQLVNLGEVVKEQIKDGDGRKLMAYKLA